jgi:hypothetical protein
MATDRLAAQVAKMSKRNIQPVKRVPNEASSVAKAFNKAASGDADMKRMLRVAEAGAKVQAKWQRQDAVQKK